MPSHVFSTQLFNAPSVSGGPTVMYTVPFGKVTVVKSIVITWGIVTVSGIDAWVQDNNLCKLWRYTWFTSLTSTTNNGGSSPWWGMAVLLEGQTLAVQTGAGTCDITCAGYELALP